MNMRALADGLVLTVSLLLRPSAWAERVKRDLGMGPDFSLVDLWQIDLRPGAISSFLGRSLLGWLLVASVEGVLVLSLLGLEGRQVLPALGILLVLCLGGGLVVAFCLSVSAALSGAFVILAIFALGLVESLHKVGNLDAMNAQMAGLSIPTGVFRGFAAVGERSTVTGFVISLGIGIVGFLAARPEPSASIRPLPRVASAALTGVAVSAGIAGLALLVAALWRDVILSKIASSAALGFGTAFCVACAVLIGRGLIRPSLYAFLATGISWSVLAWAAFSQPLPLAGTVALGAALRAAFFSSYFCLSFALASWVGGPWAGAFAAALGSGAAFAVRFGVEEGLGVAVVALLVKLGAVVLGLLLPLWLPLLSYPFELLWNASLFHVDRQRGSRGGGLLSLNSGLWNGYQYLRLYGLDDHLYLVLNRDLPAGEKHLETARRGLQEWAAEAAELRILVGKRLAKIESVEGLAHLHRDADPVARLERAGRPYDRIPEVARMIDQGRGLRRMEDRVAALRIVEEHLEAIALELGGTDATARTFRRLVSAWREILAAHVARLAAGLQQERLVNPYAVGGPVIPGFGVFVGRTEIAARIASALESDHPPPILVRGESRIGKSSLLTNLARLLPGGYLPCYADLQRASGIADEAELYSCIAADLLEDAVRLQGSALPRFRVNRLHRPPKDHFRGWVDSLVRSVSPRRLVFLFDELEELENLRGVVDPRHLLSLLLLFVRPPLRCGLVLAASPRVAAMEWVGWAGNLYTVEVGHLRRHEAEDLILRPTTDFPLLYTPTACERMIRLSGCHPALLQRLCWEVVRGARAGQGIAQVNLEDVEAAARKTLEGSILLLRTLIESLSVDDLRFLRRLARQGQPEAVPEAGVQKLIDREILERQGGGIGFKAALLERWLASTPDS